MNNSLRSQRGLNLAVTDRATPFPGDHEQQMCASGPRPLCSEVFMLCECSGPSRRIRPVIACWRRRVDGWTISPLREGTPPKSRSSLPCYLVTLAERGRASPKGRVRKELFRGSLKHASPLSNHIILADATPNKPARHLPLFSGYPKR